MIWIPLIILWILAMNIKSVRNMNKGMNIRDTRNIIIWDKKMNKKYLKI